MSKIDLSGLDGLTAKEAAARLASHGPNALPTPRSSTLWTALAGALREPMFVLLLGCSGLYFVLGDVGEASFLAFAVALVVWISVSQERRAERTLETLRSLASPRALVIRDGKHVRIPSLEVVPGDIVVLDEGDRVPADGRLLRSSGLKLDESLLTGESAPALKDAAAAGNDAQVAAGTLVVQGRALFTVAATGKASAIGRIGRALDDVERPKSRLQVETRHIVRLVAMGSLILSIALGLVILARGGGWIEGALLGLTFAMATIPEEFPVVLTVFTALGAWRIAKKRVLTRKLTAIETLGAATVLCVDKTGTLTINKMEIAALWCRGVLAGPADAAYGTARHFRTLRRIAALASDATSIDPMDSALVRAGATTVDGDAPGMDLVRAYPLSSTVPMMAQVWRVPGEDALLVAAKGAPEVLIARCSLSPDEKDRALAGVRNLALGGYRVLAVASARLATSLPADQRAFGLSLEGLVAFVDPIRPEVPTAVSHCREAGVRIVMITGDHPTTATAVAAKVGIHGDADDVLLGNELVHLDDRALTLRLRHTNVLARMRPEQKLAVVEALRASGEVVGMTGDGVNDAPALKAAHIGIAMGSRGSDVAREAADLVLLDDDFASLVAAIQLGRRIYDNLQKAVGYIIAIHVPIVGMSLIPAAFGMPLILWPVHVVFLELIIDPVSSLVFEAEPAERDAMRRPPRSAETRLFSRRLLLRSLGKGGCILGAAMAAYLLNLNLGQSPESARTVAFATLIFANLGLILSERSRFEIGIKTLRRKSSLLFAIGGVVVSILVATVYVPQIRELFKFSPLRIVDWAAALAAAAASLAGFEFSKMLTIQGSKPCARAIVDEPSSCQT